MALIWGDRYGSFLQLSLKNLVELSFSIFGMHWIKRKGYILLWAMAVWGRCDVSEYVNSVGWHVRIFRGLC